MPDSGRILLTPTTSSTPPAGSISVVAISTVSLLWVLTKTVFGMVTGVLFASGGAATSMRTAPVTVLSPSFATYCTRCVRTSVLLKTKVPRSRLASIRAPDTVGTPLSRRAPVPPRTWTRGETVISCPE